MKINAKLTITRNNSDELKLRVRDEASRLEFLDLLQIDVQGVQGRDFPASHRGEDQRRYLFRVDDVGFIDGIGIEIFGILW